MKREYVRVADGRCVDKRVVVRQRGSREGNVSPERRDWRGTGPAEMMDVDGEEEVEEGYEEEVEEGCEEEEATHKEHEEDDEVEAQRGNEKEQLRTLRLHLAGLSIDEDHTMLDKDEPNTPANLPVPLLHLARESSASEASEAGDEYGDEDEDMDMDMEDVRRYRADRDLGRFSVSPRGRLAVLTPMTSPESKDGRKRL